MAFTKGLWNRISEIYEEIIDHPFNWELAQGALPAEKFKFYIQQDALYLVDFARALAIVGAKALLPERILDFLEFAKEGLIVERGLHEEYSRRFDVTLDAKQRPPALRTRTISSPPPRTGALKRRCPRSCPPSGSTARWA